MDSSDGGFLIQQNSFNHILKIKKACIIVQILAYFISWGEWPSGINSFHQVTEVKLGRVRSNCGWMTLEA